MSDATAIARAHYYATGLTTRIQQALLAVAPEDRPLTVAELAAMDQFHTRGILATKDLAAMTPISPGSHVLDLGSGVGGPARYLASAFGCKVTGVDLSESFVDAARYLTGRCGLQDKVSFQVGDALDLPFAAASFDLVFLQHVAMNIQDRPCLYAEVARVLTPGGRLAIHDVVLKGGNVHYPTPWARDPSGSFLLTADQTRQALVGAGLEPVAWRDDSEVALAWFSMLKGGQPAGPTLAVVLGPDFPALAGNLSRNLREGRIGILSAIAERA